MGIARKAFIVASLVAATISVHDAHAQSAPKMFFEGDMVLAQACVLNNRFRHNEGVVWRVRVLDAETGKQLDGKALKSLVVQLPDGKQIPMKYGSHPKGAGDDFFWSISWKVPESYPTGTFAYTIVATGLDGATTRWQPFNVKNSQLTIVED